MKRKSLIIGLSVSLGVSLWFNMYALNENKLLSEDYTEVATDYNELLDEYEELERTNERLNSRTESASVWFEMTEEEKENAKKEVEIRKEEERKAEEERLAKEKAEREKQERLAKEEKEKEKQEEISKRKGNINKSEYVKINDYVNEEDKVYIEGKIVECNNIYGGNVYKYTVQSDYYCEVLYAYVYVNDLEGCQSSYQTCDKEWKSRIFYGKVIGFETHKDNMGKERKAPIISVDYIEE